MSAEHDAAGASRRASARRREAALEDRLRALAVDLDDEPAPDFRAATRARLVAMAAVRSPEPAPEPGPRRGLSRLRAARPAPGRPAWRSRLTAGVAGAALAVTALGSLVALSTDAEPGDALYALKRGTEQTQLALAGDERGLTLLEFATTRLQELGDLVEDGAATPPADLVVDTLATMDAQTTEGAALVLTQAVAGRDAAPLAVLAGWAEDQGSGLAGLQDALPADAGTAATRSLEVVSEVGTRAAELRTALDCPAGPAVSGADRFGPLPVACGATPAPPTAGSGTTAPAPAGPGAPTPDQPAAPSTQPAPPPAGSGTTAPSSAPPAPSTGGGPAAPTGSGGGSVPTGGTAPTTAPPVPGGGLPLPPLPLPGGGGQPSAPSTTTPPPVLDTPLPICLWPIIC
ncbi:DUF5667 domain-containing protein [Geodermatophilus sp. SYSU D00867]